ncbi:ABC transporter substrate-binding protein [Dactylosporangium sp. CA-092794]|uniref:branched-chain amino acid ABC transporter substrate-binding protein n=1 Tax=Dactylosporangium sp. CA-092794 TaxID=3239929 RepID=UPI003D92487B
MIGPWEIGLAVAIAIAGGYALWRLVAVARFRRATAPHAKRPATPPKAEAASADRLVKRAETAVARLREQTDSPSDPVLRAQIGDVDDHAAEVLADLRRFAEQVKALERSLHEIPVERLRRDLGTARHQRDEAGDAALRAELDRSVHALEQQLAVADRMDTTRRTLLARIEAAVFDLEGLGVRVTELIVMHDSAGASDTEARLSELTGDLEGMRAGLAEARGLSDSVLGRPDSADSPDVPKNRKNRAEKHHGGGRQPAAAEEAKPDRTEDEPERPAVPAKPGRARWDLVALAVVLVAAVTCLAQDFLPHGGSPSATATQDANECPQTLAFMAELTGDGAGDGPGELDAVELAVAQDNAAHADGCQVRLQQYDTAVTGDVAKSASLIAGDPSILGVVGPTYGSEATKAVPVFESAGLAVISPSASDSVLTTKGWKVFHRTLPSDDDQADAAARYLRDTLKARRVFVIGDDTDFGVDVSARIAATLGGAAVAGHAAVTEDTADWSPLVNQVKGSGADAVYFGGYADDVAPFVQRLRAVLPKIPVVSGDRIITESFRKTSGDAGHGTYATCPCVPVNEGIDAFRTQFNARFGESPQFYAPETYDAARIILAGLRAGKTTRPAMLQFVDAWDGDGLGRHIKFGPGGGLAVPALNVWAYQTGSDGYFVAKTAIV